MAIVFKNGDIFQSECQTLVNTVNTEGFMGAGIALEFKYRYPEMNKRYIELCNDKLFNIGQLWLYRGRPKWVLNFPTKQQWRYPSKISYLRQGLQNFVDTYSKRNITSIAFPLLGVSNGKIDKSVALSLMQEYLTNCSIYIEIYNFRSELNSPYWDNLKQLCLNSSKKEVMEIFGIRESVFLRLYDAVKDNEVKSYANLSEIKGIGEKSISNISKFLNVGST